MKRYETIVILDPDISDEDRAPVFERISDTIDKGDGFLVSFDHWGTRKLAYEIKKKPRGHYTRIDYCGTGVIVDEIERFFRIDDRVMKYLTVMFDENADVEKIKEGIARAESEKEKTEAVTAEEGAVVDDAPPADTVEADEKTDTDAAVETDSDDDEAQSRKED